MDYDCLISDAVRTNNLDFLQKLHDEGTEFGWTVCEDATYTGNLEILKFLKKIGNGWNDRITMKASASAGKLEILRWMHENGCSCSRDTFDYAMKSRNLEVLNWLRDTGCPWGESLLCSAVCSGDLHVLEWISKNGFVFEDTTLYAATKMAAGRSCVEILEFLAGFVELDVPKLAKIAFRSGQYENFRWLTEKIGRGNSIAVGLDAVDLYEDQAMVCFFFHFPPKYCVFEKNTKRFNILKTNSEKDDILDDGS